MGAILLLIGLAGYQSIREFDETVDWVANSQEVLGQLQLVLSDVQDIEIKLRDYVMSGKEPFMGPYVKGLDRLSRDREKLSSIIPGNPQDRPEQPRNIQLLNALIDKKVMLSKTMLALRHDIPYQPARMESYMTESRELIDSIRGLIEDMQTLERVQLIARDRHADQKGKDVVLYFVVGLLIEIMILIWIAWQIRREISQREQAQDALRQTHDKLELRVQERTKALVESNERLRELSHRLMNVQETERRQIAHDLHDEIGQSLTAMKLELRDLPRDKEHRVIVRLSQPLPAPVSSTV